ncbi:hemin uptake protein HemP [Lentibacter sp. XHP0401]|jgi:hemin uptake protein HemP|uniref:hemin uptake protein HemP n=1 Tax=Lentibacter sp. XHP0401 TaxID=2984334 RepID=UPI0021E87FB4|nr:hemin uptake protein HemP [Lentibacter sp. XHP0401]MCV2894250.1 hemin uptake protein HemP [Lentibacter sp. XHP0401]
MSFENPNPTAGQVRQAIPKHSASELMKDGSLAHIEHEGQIYTLRITRAGKLILTK